MPSRAQQSDVLFLLPLISHLEPGIYTIYFPFFVSTSRSEQPDTIHAIALILSALSQRELPSHTKAVIQQAGICDKPVTPRPRPSLLPALPAQPRLSSSPPTPPTLQHYPYPLPSLSCFFLISNSPGHSIDNLPLCYTKPDHFTFWRLPSFSLLSTCSYDSLFSIRPPRSVAIAIE